MSDAKEDLMVDIKVRVKEHSDSYEPSVECKPSPAADNVVTYILDLSREQDKTDYEERYQEGDTGWVAQHGHDHYNLLATLRCEWQI